MRVIGGDTFQVYPLAAMDTWCLQPLILPALGHLATLYGLFVRQSLALVADGTLQEGQELDPVTLLPQVVPMLEQAGPVITKLCQVLPPPQLQEVTRALLRSATINGKPLFSERGDTFNVLMQGRTLDTWQLVIFAMEVSYPDFFAKIRLAGAAAAADAPSISPPT